MIISELRHRIVQELHCLAPMPWSKAKAEQQECVKICWYIQVTDGHMLNKINRKQYIN